VKLLPFRMERYQSTWENRVRFNLSESGVHPLTLGELLELAGQDPASLAALRLGYGQSNGTEELRARIAALYPGAGEDNVLVTAGSAEANFACLWHLMEPGGTAAVMLPNYMQVPGLLENFGGSFLPFHLLEREGWRPDLEALEGALARGARFVLVTHPNNPTGRALDEASIDAIVGLAERSGAWILADEVYRGAEVDGEESPSFWGRSERVLVTHSLSKAYGLPGLRLGWVVGPSATVEELWARTDYTTISPASLSDHLARLALEPATRAGLLARTRRIIRENLATLTGWLEERGELFAWRPPDAGAIGYVRYQAPVGSTELAEKLRVEKDVLVVPGDHFGMDSYLRIGFGPPKRELIEALGRVAEAFEEVLVP